MGRTGSLKNREKNGQDKKPLEQEEKGAGQGALKKGRKMGRTGSL